MKATSPAHQYELSNFENSNDHQSLSFICKEPDGQGGSRTIHDGTTNEEVLKCLIDRTKFLNEKFPCRENSIAITKMEEALMWFEKRTADRIARGVEGKHIK